MSSSDHSRAVREDYGLLEGLKPILTHGPSDPRCSGVFRSHFRHPILPAAWPSKRRRPHVVAVRRGRAAAGRLS